MLLELMGWDLGQLQDLLVSDHWHVVKHEQEEHLVGRDKELIAFSLDESAAELSVTQG